MKRSVLLVAFFLISSFCWSQDLVINYNRKSSKIISTIFSDKVIPKITCEYFLTNGRGHDDFAGIGYPCDADTIIDTVGRSSHFRYSLYSEDLRYTLKFVIWLSDDLIYKNDSIISNQIPECVKLDSKCGFVNFDSAQKIALKNVPGYSIDLFTSSLEKDKENNEFNWFISMTRNKPNSTTRKNSPQKGVLINAKSGKIIKINSW
ncbi:MAG: hypothetical protein QM737_18725 [Ferruginibacter sp.]